MTAPIDQRLREAAAGLRGEHVALHELADAHGHATLGTLLVLLAVPCMLPIAGTGTVLGVGLVALALAMWRGHETVTLPQRVAQFRITQPAAQRVLALLARFYAMAGRLMRERLAGWAQPSRGSWLAAKALLMAVLIVLPIPFGNVLPALSLVALGLGLVFRDGLAVMASAVFAALAVLFTVGLAAATWHFGSAWLAGALPV